MSTTLARYICYKCFCYQLKKHWFCWGRCRRGLKKTEMPSFPALSQTVNLQFNCLDHFTLEGLSYCTRFEIWEYDVLPAHSLANPGTYTVQLMAVLTPWGLSMAHNLIRFTYWLVCWHVLYWGSVFLLLHFLWIYDIVSQAHDTVNNHVVRFASHDFAYAHKICILYIWKMQHTL